MTDLTTMKKMVANENCRLNSLCQKHDPFRKGFEGEMKVEAKRLFRGALAKIMFDYAIKHSNTLEPYVGFSSVAPIVFNKEKMAATRLTLFYDVWRVFLQHDNTEIEDTREDSKDGSSCSGSPINYLHVVNYHDYDENGIWVEIEALDLKSQYLVYRSFLDTVAEQLGPDTYCYAYQGQETETTLES